MADEKEQLSGELSTPHICEGGNLDCGSGLLLLIRKAMEQVPAGELLEIRSTEISVREDLPAWCRMTENPFVGWLPAAGTNKFYARCGGGDEQTAADYQRARSYRWQTRTRWSEGLATQVFCRNHSWRVGQPASFDLKDEAPSAVEYILGALGSCLAMGFQIRASQRGLEIDELEVSLSGEIDNILVFLGIEPEGHSGFKQIGGTLYVQSDADEAELAEIWRETLTVSPVANTLGREVKMAVELRVV